MNISKQTIEQLKSEFFSFTFYDNFLNEVSPQKATELNIGFDKDYNYIGKTIKETKKETTIDYIMCKINTDKVYVNFCNSFKKLLPTKYQNSITVYPASYGIGIFVFFDYRGQMSAIKEQIKSILDNLNIDYLTEYSDAQYVFRYKISKSKKNIDKINSL